MVDDPASWNIAGCYGTPIILGDGQLFGTLCVIDTVPVELGPHEQEAMSSLAMLVACAIDLERLTTHDMLTGLHNRALFDDRLKLEVARADRNGSHFALVSIDLDGFGSLNTGTDRQLGDEVLASVALRLRSTVRRGDTTARIGNDEFALILPDIREIGDAARVTRALLESLQDPIRVRDKAFAITASIGVVVYPIHGQDPTTLMERAGEALQAARTEGGDSFRFSSRLEDAYQRQAAGRPRLRILSNTEE